MSRLDELEKLVEVDPSGPALLEYLELLNQAADFKKAILVAVAGLSADPANKFARLALAESFIASGYLPFAVRELLEVRRQAGRIEIPSLDKLLRQLGAETSDLATTESVKLSEQVAEEPRDIAELEVEL